MMSHRKSDIALSFLENELDNFLSNISSTTSINLKKDPFIFTFLLFDRDFQRHPGYQWFFLNCHKKMINNKITDNEFKFKKQDYKCLKHFYYLGDFDLDLNKCSGAAWRVAKRSSKAIMTYGLDDDFGDYVKNDAHGKSLYSEDIINHILKCEKKLWAPIVKKSERYWIIQKEVFRSVDNRFSLQVLARLSSSNLSEYFKIMTKQMKRLEYSLLNVFDNIINNRKQFVYELKTAIISILVDSFAHNISAHSLAALKWWFHIRDKNIYDKQINVSEGTLEGLENKISKADLESVAKKTTQFFEQVGQRDGNNDNNYTTLKEIVQYFDIKKVEKLFTYQNGQGKFRFPIPIDYAIYQYLKFLRDKAGFWSGVTRDVNFGGESKNLYEVIWKDLCQNSLYLGTIAHSEGIHKINIKVELPELAVQKKCKLKRIRDFAIIDLSILKYDELYAKGEIEDVENEDVDETLKPNIYKFVQLGSNHREIREELRNSKYDAYFPGGIVGEHAFLTIIENTLRNIKHYKNCEGWDNIKNNGINLVISIEPKNLMEQEKTDKDKELFEIEIYLDHKTNLKEGKDDKKVVKKLRKKAADSVLTSAGSPRLGGSSQDKICSSMLLNGTFDSVSKAFCDNEDIKERNDYYYNSDITSKNIQDEDYRSWIGFREDPKNEEQGVLKKYFYLWKSDLILEANDKDELRHENINRFKFLKTDNNEIVKNARKNGVIRVINDSGNTNLEWLDKWLNIDNIAIIFGKCQVNQTGKATDPTPACCIYKSKTDINFFNYKQFLQNYNKITCNSKDVKLLHDGDHKSTIHIRNHGTFLEKILEENFSNMSKAKITDKNKIFDLLEIILTKIVVFDDRLFERFYERKSDKIDTIRDMLNIEFYPENGESDSNNQQEKNSKEDKSIWQRFKDDYQLVKDINFLILHLSFIESIEKEDGNKYKETEIKDFIDNEIISNKNEIPENFILVITTGRGRIAFWENLDNNQKTFVTFKPIESLLSALEDALIYNDDFQIKYNICKVLFGS